MLPQFNSSDVAYLQHGSGAGPFRTESVKLKHEKLDRYLAFFEGRWRRVYIGMKRNYIVFRGEKITLVSDGL